MPVNPQKNMALFAPAGNHPAALRVSLETSQGISFDNPEEHP
jgi:hypothetical protein